MKDSRVIWIDAAKGFGIIMVILGHLGVGIPIIGQYLTAFRMPMYFIITGFFLKGINFKTYIIKRFKRLLIPYFIYGICLNFLLLIYLFFKNKFSITLVLEKIAGLLYSRYSLFPLGTEDNMYFLSICAPMWFLTALFSASVLAMPFFYINDRHKKLLICCYIVTAFLLNELPVLLPWSLDTAFVGALFIYFGFKFKTHIVPPGCTHGMLA